MATENKCPWCDCEVQDLWEYNLEDGDAEEYDCPSCDKKIQISLSVSYDYTIKSVGCENHVLDLHPHMEHYTGKKFVNLECKLCKNEFYDHDMEPPIGKFSNLKAGTFTLTDQAQKALDQVVSGRSP